MRERKKIKKTKIIFLVIISLIIVIIDQAIKWLVINYIKTGGFFVFNKIIGIDIYYNKGIAFGISMPKVIFYIAIFLLLYLLLQKLKTELKNQNFVVLLSLALIIAGALSNLIDRFFRSAVVDYIFLFNYSVFNLADISIIMGVVILIIVEFRKTNH